LKISNLSKWCFIPIFVSGSLFIVSGAFENMVDATVCLREHPAPESIAKPIEAACDYRDSKNSDTEGNRSSLKTELKKSQNMSEIIAACIGAGVGAMLACGFAIFLRSYEQWRVFQERIYVIRARFEDIQFYGRESNINVAYLHGISLQDVTAAVCGIKPYLMFEWQRARLTELLAKYRNAPKSLDSGFIGVPSLPEHSSGWYPDLQKARDYTIEILDDMTKFIKSAS
jgi:hypothetical protein